MKVSVLKGLLILSLFCLFPGCKKASAPTTENLTIGEILTLTGPEAGIGVAIHQGIELALDQVNQNLAENAVAHRPFKKLKLVSLDDQGRPEEAAAAASKLISQQGAVALLGASASSRSIVVAGAAQKAGIPMITPTSTHPKVTEAGNYIFRVCFMDSFQGKVMAEFVTKNLNLKNVAILKDIKSDYSVGLADFFKSRIESLGGTTVAEQSYSSGDIDYKSQLTAIRAKNPDAIFIPGYYTDIALIARQGRDLGIEVPLLGGDGWSSPLLTEIGGAALRNTYYSSHFSPDDTGAVVVGSSGHVEDHSKPAFVAAFKSRFGMAPNGLSALGYDSMMLLAQSLQIAEQKSNQNKLDLDVVRQAVAATKEFDGITGKITMDSHRNAIKSAIILKFDQGLYKTAARME